MKDYSRLDGAVLKTRELVVNGMRPDTEITITTTDQVKHELVISRHLPQDGLALAVAREFWTLVQSVAEVPESAEPVDTEAPKAARKKAS